MRSRDLTRRDWLGLSALGAGALALGQYLGRGRPLGRDVSNAVDVAALHQAPGYPAEGPGDARVTMLVFSDYACGVCRRVEPSWRAAAAAAGDVRIVHRDWPVLGPASERAARVALAADRQGVYPAFHVALIRSGRLDEPSLRAALSAAGGNWEQLEADLAAHRAAIGRLLGRTARDAFQLGFAGTPSFLIGPIRLEGGASERQFADAIDRAREP